MWNSTYAAPWSVYTNEHDRSPAYITNFHITLYCIIHMYVSIFHGIIQFIRYTHLVPGRTPFVSRTAWILQGILQGVGNIPQGCWSMLTGWHRTVAADWTAVDSCSEQPVPSHPKPALLGWDLQTAQATLLQILLSTSYFCPQDCHWLDIFCLSHTYW
jgi:hypothetical protein